MYFYKEEIIILFVITSGSTCAKSTLLDGQVGLPRNSPIWITYVLVKLDYPYMTPIQTLKRLYIEGDSSSLGAIRMTHICLIYSPM